MGRGQGKRQPLKLEALAASEPAPFLCLVISIEPAGEIGTRVVLQDELGNQPTFYLFAGGLINRSNLAFASEVTYVSTSGSRLESVVGGGCSCGVNDCLHAQAVAAARSFYVSPLTASAHWKWRIGPKHPLTAHALASGVSWHLHEDDSLIGYAIRVSDNQGVLALNTLEYAGSNWRLDALVHDFVGPCQTCGVMCEEGRLLHPLITGVPELWSQAVLPKDVRFWREDKSVVFVEGSDGHTTYRMSSEPAGEGVKTYHLSAWLDGFMVAAISEKLYDDGGYVSDCLKRECIHAFWREFYDKHSEDTLVRLQKRFFNNKKS